MPCPRRVLTVWLAFLVAAGLPSANGQPPLSQKEVSAGPTAGEDPRGGNHPLAATLKWAKQQAEYLEKSIADYSAVLVSRERVDGKLGESQQIALKVRHRPFSIYGYILSPENVKGNQALYVEGQNDGKLLIRTTGVLDMLLGTLSLDPASPTAMRDRRHPITKAGILNLCRGVIRLLESDMRHPASAESRVLTAHAKVGGRACVCTEVVHPVRHKSLGFHRLRLFVDTELKIPIRYELYDWPKQSGGGAELLEEYTYLNIKLNNGFTDADFDPKNPQYGLR